MRRLRQWRAARLDRIHCPHIHVRGIYGDEINFLGGFRNRCIDCGTLLSGPVSISKERGSR
jgi:hypothetical protein